MKVGILGGSFDPPHIGHLLVARQTREMLGLDEVWFMPYFAHNWDATSSSPADRLAMTQLIVEPGIEASDEEVKQSGKSYTIDTVRRLQRRFNHEFFWIVGSDLLPEFSLWKEAQELAKLIRFLVFPRLGHLIPDKLPDGFISILSQDLVITNISSTRVRQRIKHGLSVVGLISDEVGKYIDDYRLYI